MNEGQAYRQASEKLRAIHQEPLLTEWPHLTDTQRKNLLAQIDQIDPHAFLSQLEALKKQTTTIQSFQPFHDFDLIGNPHDIEKGKQLTSEGLVGCLIVAGGQGTRLGFPGPKGMFPISLIKHKSLYQLFAEKTVAASQQAGKTLPLAIMTSPLNHQETLDYFKGNAYFGLQPDQIDFFSQGTLPFLTQDRNLFFDSPGEIAQGPDGNGSSLHHFYSSGLWQKWQQVGVKYVNYILIDNPLADPFDAELIGYHARHHNEVTVKCTLRQNAHEKVGVLIKRDAKVEVIEYNEIPEKERVALNPEGSLRHQCANLSLFCFSIDFIDRIHTQQLPLHTVYKQVKTGEQLMAWKFERFIFDTLPLAGQVRALLYPRELCFAPLKNLNGEHSLPTVQNALYTRDRQAFQALTGQEPPHHPFELAQEFYYPTKENVAKWKGKAPPSQMYLEI